MLNLRLSLALLRALIVFHPNLATEDNLNMLEATEKDIASYGKLLMLQRLVEDNPDLTSECIRATWQRVKEDGNGFN